MSNCIIDYLAPGYFTKVASKRKKDSLEDLEDDYQQALLEKDLSLKALAPSDNWIKRLVTDHYYGKVRGKDVYKKLVNLEASTSEQKNQKAIDDLIGLDNPESLRLARILANIARIEDVKNNKKSLPLLPVPSRMDDPALIQQSTLRQQHKLDDSNPFRIGLVHTF